MSPESANALLDEILSDPGRDRIPGTRPVVALAHDEDPALLEAVAARSVARIGLARRGSTHGTWAVVRERMPTARDDEALDRWRAARPLVVPRAVRVAPQLQQDALRLHGTFIDGSETSLREFADHAFEGSPFAASHITSLGPDARDLARVDFTHRGAEDDELWLKLGRLSTHADDASLRLRVSFGREVDDDASSDPRRCALVREAATALVPGARELHDDAQLARLLDLCCAAHVRPTQHIAYWNAPEGGALFHHDAFDEPEDDRQLGVVYTQLAGRTAWLALSTDDLAERVRELLEYMSEGELGHVRAHVFPGERDFSDALELAADDAALVGELALPGCGRLGPLVGHGPECTSFLADSGHGCVLEPGDAILLPNGGLARTAMHSVFCASPGVTYGLSCALRRVPPDLAPSSDTP